MRVSTKRGAELSREGKSEREREIERERERVGENDDKSVGKHVPPDGTGWKEQRTGSSQNRPRSVPNRPEGQRCKYVEKSYMYKYDLGHISYIVVVALL